MHLYLWISGLSMTQKLACYTKPEGVDLGIIVHDDVYHLSHSKGVRLLYAVTSIVCTKSTLYKPVLMQLLIIGVALKRVAYSMLKGGDIKLLDVIIEVNKQPAASLLAPFGDVVKQIGSSSLILDRFVAMDLSPALLDECE